MRAAKTWLKTALDMALRPSGYQLINPFHRYGIDIVADVTRLAKAWSIDLGTVFDVGANVGMTTLAFRAAWPGCRVFAFEPVASTAATLRDAVRPTGGVIVEEVALADRIGNLDFHLVAGASDLGSLKARAPYVERHGLRRRVTTVPVTTVDAFCRDRTIARINLLKIDTEGADHEVLLGSRTMLRQRRIDFVCCEFNSLGQGPGRLGSLVPIASLLDENGYDFIASYNDYIETEGSLFAVSNGLFATGPHSGST